MRDIVNIMMHFLHAVFKTTCHHQSTKLKNIFWKNGGRPSSLVQRLGETILRINEAALMAGDALC